MSREGKRSDALIAGLAPVRDEELVGAVSSPDAAALFSAILDSPVVARGEKRVLPRRRRVLAFAGAAVVAAVLSIPAFGVGEEIVSFFAGWKDPDAPKPTASDIVIASGENGVRWTIVATPSDQGLCLGLFYRLDGDSHGAAGCDYQEVRGDLPPDVRGDPSARCLGPPTTANPGGTLVSCGSLPKHWIGPVGSAGGSNAGLETNWTVGVVAEKVASVELVLNNGEILQTDVVERPGGLPLDIYWAVWPCRLERVGYGFKACADDSRFQVNVAIARDADGRVLERRVPAWNGNPTGDPDGPPPPSLDGT